MSVLEKAKQHYKSQLAGEIQSIEVPEWETTVYYKSTNNFMAEQKIIQLHTQGKMVEALIETLIQKALDENGNKMFRPADRDILLREVDPQVIIRVCTQINSKEEPNLGN